MRPIAKSPRSASWPFTSNQANFARTPQRSSAASEQRLSGDGTEVVTSSPEEFGALIKADVALWAEIVKRVGVRIE